MSEGDRPAEAAGRAVSSSRDGPPAGQEVSLRGAPVEAGVRDASFRALYRELRIADQQAFYHARADEYAAAHRQALMARNLLLFLSALAGVVGQFAAGIGRAACGVAAAVLAALAGAVTGFEALIGFAQLEKLYGDAALNLDAAAIDWDAAGPDADVTAEVDRIELIFRTENGQWGQLLVQREESAAVAEEPAATSQLPEPEK
ncbi:SLATT domain-containing protein [Nonomuraea rhodomycinica]|uniref:SLATT domain-containing protein n=1 Tax=Nonomuraea rhodomycinica TaxID=1712872 RepID=A0A7Y6ITK1_9ACTN|nr:SLATT domain-containing protein [Nonomuraea rhodomycinica]NUW43851.1 SLATT domain-containing protein [Nonomuraea rhodomycinica]